MADKANIEKRSDDLTCDLDKFNNILKPEKDTRSYRGVVLKNGLKVLLVKDEKIHKCSVALNIGIGYLSDPDGASGLANLCQHMLFTGSKVFPNGEDYFKLLLENDGENFAQTYADYSIFQFSVNPLKFEETLKYFSDFLHQPLFHEKKIQPQLDIIQSEFEKNRMDDMKRLDRLEKSLIESTNILSKLGEGNKETLMIRNRDVKPIQTKLINFHSNYYAANIMSLCVVAKDNLDDLNSMVQDMFCKIHYKGIEIKLPLQFTLPQKGSHEAAVMTNIVPVRNIKKLNMVFLLPFLEKLYWYKPGTYISYLLECEGDGTLLTYLKKLYWCSSLKSETKNIAGNFYLFNITMDLTEDGLNHIIEIVKAVFQYLKLIKNKGLIESFFEDYRKIGLIDFLFPTEDFSRSFAIKNVRMLQREPMNLLVLNYFYQWKPDYIKNVLEYLIPSNLKIHVIAKRFEGQADKTERWYDIKYKMEKLSSDTMKELENIEENSKFSLPRPNKFIPEDFNVKTVENDDSDIPLLVNESKFQRCWYMKDTEFMVPEASLFLYIFSPISYVTAITYNLRELFIRAVRFSLSGVIHAAKLIHTNVEITSDKNAIVIKINGFNHKLISLLNEIIDTMLNFDFNETIYNDVYREYKNELANFDAKKKSWEQAEYYLEVFLTDEVWLNDELKDALNHINFNQVQGFISLIFRRIFIECFVYGNVYKDEAIDIAKSIEIKFINKFKNIQALFASEVIPFRQAQLNKEFYFQVNTSQDTACALIYFQLGVYKSIEYKSLSLLVINILLNKRCYEDRLKGCAGDMEGIEKKVVEMVDVNGTVGIKIRLESGKKSAEYLLKAINTFLTMIETYISNMTASDVEAYKEAVTTSYIEKLKTSSSTASELWKEILAQQYNFHHDESALTFINSITHKKLIDFYKEFLQTSHAKIHIKVERDVLYGSTGGTTSYDHKTTLSNDTMEIFHNVIEYKNKRSLNPFYDSMSKSIRSRINEFKSAEIMCDTSDMDKLVQNNVKERDNDIIKSTNDKKLYRCIVLNNDLKVLLMVDKEAFEYNVALNVNIGYMSDPENIPGLAHLCEHMLLMGSRTYPVNFRTFLSQNNGRANTSTHMDHAIFEFYVKSERLKDSLDRFAELFIEPTFPQYMIHQEVQTIDAEFRKSLREDEVAHYGQFDKSTAIKKHPFVKFGAGNDETLNKQLIKAGIDVRIRLVQFFKMYYSSNIMSLCISGPGSLDELEKMAVHSFCKLPNKHYRKPEWHAEPFSSEHFGNVWYIVPKSNIYSNKLMIIFPISQNIDNIISPDANKEKITDTTVSIENTISQVVELKNSQAERFIAHLLEYRGEKTLLQNLIESGWCTSLAAGQRDSPRGFNFFSINIKLTVDGKKKIFEVIGMVFNYLKFLWKKTEVETYLLQNNKDYVKFFTGKSEILNGKDPYMGEIFNDLKNIKLQDFAKSHLDTTKQVISNAIALQKYQINQVLSAEYLFDEWNEYVFMAVCSLIKDLSPQYVRIHHFHPSYASNANLIEKWYQTRYYTQKIPTITMKRWTDQSDRRDDLFKLPPKNEFISTEISKKQYEIQVIKNNIIILSFEY